MNLSHPTLLAHARSDSERVLVGVIQADPARRLSE